MTSTPKTTGSAPHPSLLTGSCRSHLWPLKRQSLLRSKLPILVGPWLSEVGYEALYWLPFLDKLVADGLDRARLIPITRGGAGVWYDTPKALELYQMRTPQDIRVEMRERVSGPYESAKQIAWTPFERQIIRDAAETLGLTRYQVLHPLWMYHALAPFFEAATGLVWLQERTHWRQIPAPPLPDGIQLPEQFVAVRYYRRVTFTRAVDNMALMSVRQLAGQIPIVVLQSDFFADDHADLEFTGPNIINLRDLTTLTPENNLAVQSAVVARSRGFVGTYGGFSQLALRLGIPVTCFYESWQGTMVTHRHLTETLSTILGIPWTCVGLAEFPLLQSAMPQIQISAPSNLVPSVDNRARVVASVA